MNITNLYNMFY